MIISLFNRLRVSVIKCPRPINIMMGESAVSAPDNDDTLIIKKFYSNEVDILLCTAVVL